MSRLADLKVDLIDVSSGGTSPTAPIPAAKDCAMQA